MIPTASPESEKHANQHHHRGNVEDVKGSLRDERPQVKAAKGNTEDKGTVDILVIHSTFETNPAEKKRKCHGGRQDASPGEKPVRSPAQMRALIDEPLQDNR